MTDRELMQQALKLALEALKTFHYAMIDAGVLDRQEVLNQGFTAATAIRKALMSAPDETEQPAQQEPWRGLTDEEIDLIVATSCKKDSSHLDAARVARAIEAKLKEKNA